MLKTLSGAVLSATLLVGAAQAETHSLSAGYAYQEVKHFNHFAGINLKYRYEFNARYGLIGSFSFISGSDPYQALSSTGNTVKNNLRVKTTSILAGPAYRINRHVSIYGLVGVNNAQVSYAPLRDESLRRPYAGDDTLSMMKHKTRFAWGGGLQINPLDYLVLDLGYEGTRGSIHGKQYTMSGFNIGMGYSF
ncbi:Ail/Lom family outer membrane beta-barrel protein [Erwinia psidii]|uniref:Ail/Lom family protein n=1 Tax=Erwinia psidii TaxID=69224 RepID=A0A3N6S0G7_9GAMM|nr:Ail/Lom family outer membrane beta-barrel protein [Erwinia psidii]MCX8957306.1 Ail/Lom family protein [Erwinia psidii]MCX8959676.1 Ail/Lom family protein [Erwinia psidii]MCX8964619.1 Ail/Lom family protein [Erwinia psidii]RQM38267.1 Ail/Lom family protein [Erwinia psidii]